MDQGLQKLNADQQVQWLLEGIRLSRKKLFGASSEKSSASARTGTIPMPVRSASSLRSICRSLRQRRIHRSAPVSD